ncbi:hypothetical protein ACIQ57_16955 [Lysinibacillus xylanilyticus]
MGIHGIGETFIKSINIGTPEKPIIQTDEEARKLLQNNSLNNE